MKHCDINPAPQPWLAATIHMYKGEHREFKCKMQMQMQNAKPEKSYKFVAFLNAI